MVNSEHLGNYILVFRKENIFLEKCWETEKGNNSIRSTFRTNCNNDNN